LRRAAIRTLGIWIFAPWAIATAFMSSLTAAFGRGVAAQLHAAIYLLICTISRDFAFVLQRLRAPNDHKACFRCG
jgi:hypothetical protein